MDRGWYRSRRSRIDGPNRTDIDTDAERPGADLWIDYTARLRHTDLGYCRKEVMVDDCEYSDSYAHHLVSAARGTYFIIYAAR
ncbi:hypothetical protein D3C73_1611410 [compost metagenome]